MYDIEIDNFRIINNTQIALFEDFVSPKSPGLGYCPGKIEKECELIVDLEAKEDRKVIGIRLNKDLASKVVECKEDPKNEIVCCLTEDLKNLDFLYFNCFTGKQYRSLFRILLVKQTNPIYITEGIRLEELLSNDGGTSFCKIALSYAPDNAKNSYDIKHLCVADLFRQSLKTNYVGDIQSY